MLWDSLQHFQITAVRDSVDRVERIASRAAGRAGDLSMDVKDLCNRVDSLTLVSMALVELLKKETTLTDDVIRKKIEEIDLLDGKIDGKVARPPLDCPSCNRRNNARRTHCLYCGDELPPNLWFRGSVFYPPLFRRLSHGLRRLNNGG